MRMNSLLLSVVALTSGAARAVVDVQVMAGKESFTQNNAADANVVSGAVHFSPLPLVPIALGAVATQGSRSYHDEALGHVDAKLTQIGPEFMVWIPNLALSPYAKVSTAVYRKAEVSYDTGATMVRDDGLGGGGRTSLGAGLQWSPIAVVSLLGEYRQTAGTVVSRTVLFGVAAGL